MFAPVLACASGITVGTVVTLDEQESHYLLRVRRRRYGDQIELLGAKSGGWLATLLSTHDAHAKLSVDATLSAPPMQRHVELLLGMPDTAAGLEAICAACELGCARVWITRCERSPQRTLRSHRTELALRASRRQCGRLDTPEILGPDSLATTLDAIRIDHGYVARNTSDGQHDHGAARPGPGTTAGVAVGPEGGFTPEELEQFRSRRWSVLSLGPWTLRTPLAAIVALTRLHFE